MQHLIDRFQLTPHPEGGYYTEVYRSKQRVNSETVGKERSAATHIYFLLPENLISRFHVVKHDEIWHFYEGAPLRLFTYDGHDIQEEIIGTAAEKYTAVVPAGRYQAAESTGGYSFVGCTVAPGFEFEDFSFLSDDPKRKDAFCSRHAEFYRYV